MRHPQCPGAHPTPKHFISLGAGVQSSTMALMFACGELTPMPDAAIFADTQAEPLSVYEWLTWLKKRLPFPVIQVTHGNLADDQVAVHHRRDNGESYIRTMVPAYIVNESGGIAPILRKCTKDYKVNPIVREMKRRVRPPHGGKEVLAITYLGISLDEVQRMKPSAHSWIEHRWPLIDARLTRKDCLAWMKAKGFPPPPRSACVFCPYHSNAEWRRLQTKEPHEFLRAVAFERMFNESIKANPRMRARGIFMHRSCKPLDTIDFRSDVERGQGLLWDNECEGMCGV